MDLVCCHPEVGIPVQGMNPARHETLHAISWRELLTPGRE